MDVIFVGHAASNMCSYGVSKYTLSLVVRTYSMVSQHFTQLLDHRETCLVD